MIRLALCAVALAAGVTMAGSAPALAQAGQCDRAAKGAVAKVAEEHERWATAIRNGGFPEAVMNAYLVVVAYSRDAAVNGAEAKRVECTAEYAEPQEIIIFAMNIFSGGLASMAPGKSAYVDVSEILNGYPLGGPDALIPKLREQVLGGDNGTIANIIRDPWKCISFQRKC